MKDKEDAGGAWLREQQENLEALARYREVMEKSKAELAAQKSLFEAAKNDYYAAVSRLMGALRPERAKREKRTADGRANAAPLTAIQERILRGLDNLGTATVAELASELGEARGNGIGRSLAHLRDNRGLVEELRNGSWALTDAGAAIVRPEASAKA